MKKIINRILHRFKEDSLAKRMKTVTRTVEYKGLDEIKSCLVLWTAHLQEEEWLRVLTEKFRGIKIDKLCFLPDSSENTVTEGRVVFRKEDLGFGGKIQNAGLQKMLNNKYDLLVDLTLEPYILTRYVTTNAQALCVVGMKKEGGYGDILVDGVKQPLEFIEKLTALLADIKKF